MALGKEIIQPDGVPTRYHRILFIQSTVNEQCSIAVVSYVDNASRVAEEDGQNDSVYKNATTYEFPYVENMTIQDAYERLKTLEVFEDAVDA